MILKDISLNTPAENILYDEVLLYLAEKVNHAEFLRFWESKELFIVLGLTSKKNDDINIEEVTNDKIPVLRRASGGGTVLQGKGCLNYSLILSKEKHPKINDLAQSYQYILNKIIVSLKKLGIKTCFYPISDIALEENRKKISGNAQKRCKNFILHHGTLLYDFDLRKINKYLKHPPKEPDYRENRLHLDFISNVKCNITEFKKEFVKLFNINNEEKFVTDEEKKYLENLKINRDILN